QNCQRHVVGKDGKDRQRHPGHKLPNLIERFTRLRGKRRGRTHLRALLRSLDVVFFEPLRRHRLRLMSILAATILPGLGRLVWFRWSSHARFGWLGQWLIGSFSFAPGYSLFIH